MDAFRLFYLKDEVTTDKSTLDLILGIAGSAVENGEVDAAIESARDNFNLVYTYAQSVSANVNSSQLSIDNTTIALIDALQKLGFIAGDKTDLMNHYNLYSALDLDRYFDGPEKDAFIEALENAKEVLDNGDAMQEEVTEADQKLLDAAAALELKPDKTTLQRLVDTASTYEEDNYLSTGWSAFENALANANKVLADENATQEEVSSAQTLLAQAMASLRYKADKSVLEEVLGRAESLDLSGYDTQAVAMFNTVLAKAQAVFADNTLSVYEQPVVDAAVQDLENAIALLEESGSGQEPGGDTDDTGNTGNTGDTDNTGNTGNTGNSGSTGSKGNGGSTQNDGNSTAAGNQPKAAKTGDAVPITGMVGILVVSAAAAVLASRKRS